MNKAETKAEEKARKKQERIAAAAKLREQKEACAAEIYRLRFAITDAIGRVPESVINGSFETVKQYKDAMKSVRRCRVLDLAYCEVRVSSLSRMRAQVNILSVLFDILSGVKL